MTRTLMHACSCYNLKLYVCLSYGVTLAFWLAGASMGHDAPMIAGLAAPVLVSVWMIVASRNRELVRSYVTRAVNPKLFQPATVSTILLFMPMVVLASVLISILLGEPVTQFQLAAHPTGAGRPAPAVVILLIAATAGEFGWRGYAFEGLHSRYGFFRASILLSLLWALWLLPLLLVGGSFPHELTLHSPWLSLNFYLGIIPMSVLTSWVYAKNGNSLIAAVLFHGAMVVCTEALSLTEITKIIQNVVLAVVSAGVVATDRELFFDRQCRKGVYQS